LKKNSKTKKHYVLQVKYIKKKKKEATGNREKNSEQKIVETLQATSLQENHKRFVYEEYERKLGQNLRSFRLVRL